MIRILVADDEALERKALLKILGEAELQEPLQIIEAANGIEALERARLENPNIAFLDIRMPGMDGLEVARSLSDFPDPPEIVMITAYDHFTYARTALRFGVREYLLKPAAASDVLSALLKSICAIIERREERALQQAAHGIAENLKNTLQNSISMGLKTGNIDAAELQRLAMLEFPQRDWIGITLAADICRPTETRVLPSIAAHAFPRSFSALAERFLAEDLGLPPQLSWLFTTSQRSDSDNDSPDTVYEPSANALLLLFAENGADGVSAAPTRQLLLRAEELARSRIGAFYERCRDSIIGPLRIGLSVGSQEGIAEALSTARIALDLSNSRLPVLFLRSIPSSFIDGERIAEGFGGGLLSSRALSWLRENFMGSIGIEAAAQALSMSPSHLSRVLKREIGMSFGETLARIRVARAKSLLASGRSAKEAGLLTGFRDQSYFTKVFLKFEGVLPSQYGSHAHT